MTEDSALSLKIGFGVLVLAFSAVSVLVRHKAETAPIPSPLTATVTPLSPMAPLEAQPAEALAASGTPAPLDVQEEEEPVRVDITLIDPEPPRKVRKSAIAPRPVSHTVHRPVRQIKHSPPPVRRAPVVGEPAWFAPGR